MDANFAEVVFDIMRNYLLTALVAGVIIGVIIHAISGSKTLGVIATILIVVIVLVIPYLQGVQCEECGEPMGYGQGYCAQCGHGQEPIGLDGKVICNNCNRRIYADDKFCSYCGQATN